MKPAIGYEDYVRRAVFDDAAFPSEIIGTQVGTLESMKTPQLSDRWGVDDGGSFASIVASFGEWDDADTWLPVQLVSLLDVRADTAVVVSVTTLGGSTYVVKLYEYPASTFVRHVHFVFPEPVLTPHVKVEISIVSGAPASVGRLWAGPLWYPPEEIDATWSARVVDPGDVARSRGGQGYPRMRQRTRGLQMDFSAVPYEWAYGREDGSILDLQQLGFRVGTTEPVIVLPRTRTPDGEDDTNSLHRLGIYGHFVDPIEIRHSGGDLFTASARVAELL